MKCTGKTKKSGKIEKVNMEESTEEESEEEEHEDEICIEAEKENEEEMVKNTKKGQKCINLKKPSTSKKKTMNKSKEEEENYSNSEDKEELKKTTTRRMMIRRKKEMILVKKTEEAGREQKDDLNNEHEFESLTGDDREVAFSMEEKNCGAATIRDCMQTLAPQLKVESNVIGTFSLVLNHEQKMNSKCKKTKYFFHTTMITKDMFNWKKANGKYDEEKQFEAFSKTIQSEFKNDPEMENMKDLEMAFFPIISHEHYYLVVFNCLKGNTKKLFSMHLEKLKHLRAKDVLNKNPTIIRPKWGTKENDTYCGIFLMMHMEHYNGETAKSWNLEFPT
nr:hypothetical protein [Tanacetum cinerariifolium]